MSNPVPVGPQQPAVRPRVRARRGQATDPHSIAERVRTFLCIRWRGKGGIVKIYDFCF